MSIFAKLQPTDKIRIKLPGGGEIESFVTQMIYAYNGTSHVRIEWRSVDGQYSGDARISDEELAGADSANLVLKATSANKAFSEYPHEAGWQKEEVREEVSADLSQIEADLAKLPPPPPKTHLTGLISEMAISLEAVDSASKEISKAGVTLHKANAESVVASASIHACQQLWKTLPGLPPQLKDGGSLNVVRQLMLNDGSSIEVLLTVRTKTIPKAISALEPWAVQKTAAKMAESMPKKKEKPHAD